MVREVRNAEQNVGSGYKLRKWGGLVRLLGRETG
jgi:hypothetical protein